MGDRQDKEKFKRFVNYYVPFLISAFPSLITILIYYLLGRQISFNDVVYSILFGIPILVIQKLFSIYNSSSNIFGIVNDLYMHVHSISVVVSKGTLVDYEEVVGKIFDNNSNCISEYRHIYIVSFLPFGALQLLNKMLPKQYANLDFDLHIYIYLPTIWEAIQDIEDKKQTEKDLVYGIKKEIGMKVANWTYNADTMNFLRQLYKFKTNQGSDVDGFFKELSNIIGHTSKISLYLGLLTPPFISTVFANKGKLSSDLSSDNLMIIKSHVYYNTYSLSDKAYTNTVLSNTPCFPSLYPVSKDNPISMNIFSRTIDDIVTLLGNNNIVKVDLQKELFLKR